MVVEGQEYFEYDQSLQSIKKLAELYNKGQELLFSGVRINPNRIEKIRIYETVLPNTSIIGGRVWDVGINVTRHFISSPPSEAFAPRPRTKRIFIVHGRDHKPMKELKTILEELDLNPIVLHEQPSGSRTIVEKLEKYSDVGYSFVILTPDDLGYESDLLLPRIHARSRARQNVVLEFGYFMGLLGRDKVCCLYKGEIDLPSDMHGIVYIPFKDSLNEVKDKIIKELKEAGYKINI